GAFGRMEITLENLPLAHNPKSSALTALSLVRLIENRANPLVI
ncbi:aspartate dehydrogenase domain-containing protein, partial [Brevundimonas sp.]